MNLQQLRYIVEVSRCGMNISHAAESLKMTQPAISIQIRNFERNLGVKIFDRGMAGKKLKGFTQAGQAILDRAKTILSEVHNIEIISKEYSDPSRGVLSIATTHTQARYKLPSVLKTFVHRFPEVRLNIKQGTPIEIVEMAMRGDVDCCITTQDIDSHDDLLMLPCYRWNRCIITPCGHPLRDEKNLTLEAVAKYPIITYVDGFTGRSKLDRAFVKAGLIPNVVLNAADTDVIKAYVRQGLGVAIVSNIAYDSQIDTDLFALDVSHLFEDSVTSFGLRRDSMLPSYLYDFIELFAPHLTREQVEEAQSTRNGSELSNLSLNAPFFPSVEHGPYLVNDRFG